MSPSRHAGFTLLEICLAVFLAMMIILLAVPSVSSLLREQRGNATFERFDAMVLRARELAVAERHACLLLWDADGIVLRPEKAAAKSAGNEGMRLDVSKDESYEISFPAALVEKPPRAWIFWPSGTCEPAKITYSGPGGGWSAQYDPLTARPAVPTNETK